MKNSKINSSLFAFKAILAGFLTAQLLGIVYVFLSNTELFRTLQMVQKAGYLAVPNELIWPSLQGFGAAFWGGLFFSLSIGAGLSIGALICAWTWDRLFGRRKTALIILLPIWLLSIGAVNANGFCFPATAYFLLVPPVVFLATLYWLPPAEDNKKTRWYTLAYLGVPALLVLLFLPLAKKSIFTDIRDTVLLSNSMGRKINDFYYDYTLYAAQAFKSLDQKTIRTCRLTLAENESHRLEVENIFLSHDYLVLDNDVPVDLVSVEQDGKLLLMDRDEVVVTTTLQEFSAKPAFVLQQFSQRTDNFGPLRLMTFAFMVLGAPLCFYIIIHSLFFLMLTFYMEQKRAGIIALLLCMLMGIFIALPLYGIKNITVDLQNFSDALASERWQERVAALRYMEQNGLTHEAIIAQGESRLKSPHIAERYWYVRALGNSKSPEAGRALLAALDDSSINVVCMAFYSLGRRGDRSMVSEMKSRITNSNKWYEQWYGYRALRALGWRQGP